MPSSDNKNIRCSKCGTLLNINITYGVYPHKSVETAICPVCGYELFHKNITGDIGIKVESLEETIEPYKTVFKNKCNPSY